MKELYKALENLLWLTQLGLNMMMPLLLCLAGVWWGTVHWGWPLWLYLPAVLLGLAGGAVQFLNFSKLLQKRSHENDAGRRVGFNKHL